MHRWAGSAPSLCAKCTAACLMRAPDSDSLASANPFGLPPLKPSTHQRMAARAWRPHLHLCGRSRLEVGPRTSELRLARSGSPAVLSRRAPVPATRGCRAASVGKPEAIVLLLDAKARIDPKDAQGATPLYVAIASDQAQAAFLLAARGADLNVGAQCGACMHCRSVGLRSLRFAWQACRWRLAVQHAGSDLLRSACCGLVCMSCVVGRQVWSAHGLLLHALPLSAGRNQGGRHATPGCWGERAWPATGAAA